MINLTYWVSRIKSYKTKQEKEEGTEELIKELGEDFEIDINKLKNKYILKRPRRLEDEEEED
jgi:hypothetical protein